MDVELAYGRNGLTVQVPDDATVLLPRQVPGLPDEAEGLRAALRSPIASAPLRERVKADDRVVVVFSDITRPMPSDRVLPVVLAELAHVPRQNIVLLNALGTHRPNTPEELEAMLGPDIVRDYQIVQHDGWDTDNLVDLGTTRFGHRAQVNKLYLESSFKILTGFIEPHIFAGFSGGPKAVLPGVAGFEGIMDNHGYDMMRHPMATWGRTEGNPVWEEMRDVAALTAPDFLVNVTLNRHRAITAVFAGDIWEAHRQGTEFVRGTAMVPVDDYFDIVLTTNSGYPLDINLYQCAKGMSCAEQIVKQGGAIVIAAECQEGVPAYGEYRNIVHEGGSLQGILDIISQPGYRRHDQWEAQLQVRIQQRAEVLVHTGGLSDEELRGMLFTPCGDIPATLDALIKKYGPGARLCVIPEGPQTIPYVAKNG
ncbi:MAG: nickel-dependent lactate racemase [Anaerolineae bacterium]